MARPINYLERDYLVVDEGRKGVEFLVRIVVGADKSLGDKSDDHRCKAERMPNMNSVSLVVILVGYKIGGESKRDMKCRARIKWK